MLCAGEPPVEAGPGATRDVVIAAYGRPTGQSKLGSKEILNYSQGQVVLDDGRVVKVDFRNGAPKSPAMGGGVTGAARPTVPPAAVPRKEGWVMEYDDALRESAQRHVPILVWFAGSDWSPASRQFEDEVASQPEFSRALGAGYVFLRVDLPAHNADQATSHASNYKLRERLGVTVYPALLVLAETGEKLAKIELARPRNGEGYVGRVVASVREMHDLLGLPPLPRAAGETESASAMTMNRPAAAVTPEQVTLRLLSAGWGVISAVGTGLFAMAFLFWLLWRNWARNEPARPPVTTIAHRISEAASGLPTYDEIVKWPKERVVVVAAGLGESEGYMAEFQRPGSDKEIVFKKIGEPGAQGYVCCAGANAGVITVKRIRELIGMLTADGVRTGWFVAPLGFAAEARAYAEKHGLKLIDGHRLVALLHELPPVAVPSVTRQPWART